MPQKSSEIGEKRRKGKDKMIERKKRNGKFSAKHVRQIENIKRNINKNITHHLK